MARSTEVPEQAVAEEWSERRPGLQPPPGNPRFPGLDGVRGMAALAILAVHGLVPKIAQSANPFWVHFAFTLRVWLALFFLLSGFLLYRPYVLARTRSTPRPSNRAFWRRRVLRIVPAYWVAITLLAVWPGLTGIFSHDWWRYYAFVWTYSPRTVNTGLQPAWTLCADGVFYLLLPFYARAMARILSGRQPGEARRLELVALGVLYAAALAFWIFAIGGRRLSLAQLDIRQWSFLANVDWFVIGMVFAILSDPEPGRAGWLARLLSRRGGVPVCLFVALVGFLLTAHWIFTMSLPLQHLIAGLLCACVFAPAVLAGGAGTTRRLLANPLVAWLGLVAYGIYLYHAPVMEKLYTWIEPGSQGVGAYTVVVAVGLPIAIMLGALSYHLVEYPFLRRRY